MATPSLLPGMWQAPQQFRDRLGQEAGRQRAMFADGHLLLVLHKPPGPEDDQRVGRFFWRTPEGVWSSDCFGGGPGALARHLDEYTKLVEQLEQREDAATSADDYYAVLEGIAPIQRSARNLHQTMQEARELIPDDKTFIPLRDQAYSIERMAELLYSGVKNSLDYAVAKRSEELAKSSHKMAISSHRLNVLAAFFFPIATLMAIFGTNLKHGLEDADAPLPFLVVLAIGFIAGCILTTTIRRPPPEK